MSSAPGEEGLDRFNIHAQLEHMFSKYEGTGNADTTKHEWISNIHKDTYASHIASWDRLAYFCVATGCPTIDEMRTEFFKALVKPCPKESELDDPEVSEIYKWKPGNSWKRPADPEAPISPNKIPRHH